MEDGDRPWLKPFVHTPAARDPEPGASRKRPLIYVYELPAIYNSVLLQVRAGLGFVLQFCGRLGLGVVASAAKSQCCRMVGEASLGWQLRVVQHARSPTCLLLTNSLQYRVDKSDCMHRARTMTGEWQLGSGA